MSPADIIYSQILPKEAWVFSEEDAIEKITYLNNHEEEYIKLLNKERELVNQFIIDYPIHSLEVALQQKRRSQTANKYVPYNDIDFYLYSLKKIRQKGIKKVISFVNNGWG